ncbi:hypothetical protein K435DRAFT_623867, partial [Dendrothele bispora CBS 962.96]
RAKSERKKKQDVSRLKDQYMQRAIELYQAEQLKEKSKQLSLVGVCRLTEQQCFQETNKHIKLSDSTLHRRVNGGQSHAEAHEVQRWLNNDETEALIQEVIYYAERGFPLDH